MPVRAGVQAAEPGRGLDRFCAMRFMLASALVLTACGAEPPAADNSSQAVPAAVTPAAVTPAAVAIALVPPGNAAGHLTGELACTFSAGGPPLLIARADVADDARAQAMIRDGARAVQMTADQPGGFNAMEGGAAFSGDGYRANLSRGGRQETGSEATRHDATLRVTRADGAVEQMNGEWVCGP